MIPLVVTVFVTDDGDPFHWGDIVFGALIFGGPWLAGLMMRLRRERERSLTLRTVELERDQDERARAAVAEERARIARELHDVVAHAISVVVVQARGGRRVGLASLNGKMRDSRFPQSQAFRFTDEGANEQIAHARPLQSRWTYIENSPIPR